MRNKGETYTPRHHNIHQRQLQQAKPPPLIRAIHNRGAWRSLGRRYRGQSILAVSIVVAGGCGVVAIAKGEVVCEVGL